MSAATQPTPAAGDRCELHLGEDVTMAFRFIPATGPNGFRMGSRDGPDGWTQTTEQPVHRVCLREFWLGETPVTQAQFARWTKDHEPEHRNEFPGHSDHPAENLDWRQATRYCAWLTGELREQFPAGFHLTCLPTEAEWEYACRAGTETDYHTGDGEAALAEAGRFGQDYAASTRPVRLGMRNAWGLYDLHGHVWQWCHDVWKETAFRERVDGAVDVGHNARELAYRSAEAWGALLNDTRFRVIRGGSWGDAAGGCRSAARDWRGPVGRNRDQGFRVCLVRGPAGEGGVRGQVQKAQAPRAPEVGGRGTRPETPGAGGAEAAPDDDFPKAHFTGEAGRKHFFQTPPAPPEPPQPSPP